MAGGRKGLGGVGGGGGWSMESGPVPGIGAAEVLVGVKAASICGTDLHIYGWDRWWQGGIKPPVTLGHEFCGVVEQVGEEVTAVEGGGVVRGGGDRKWRDWHLWRSGVGRRLRELRHMGKDSAQGV